MNCVFPRQSSSPKFPCVFKVGHAHGGQGKVKVENEARSVLSVRVHVSQNISFMSHRFQDMTSVVAVSNTYCTVEPYIDSKFDLHVQKIGGNYKTLMQVPIAKVMQATSFIVNIHFYITGVNLCPAIGRQTSVNPSLKRYPYRTNTKHGWML